MTTTLSNSFYLYGKAEHLQELVETMNIRELEHFAVYPGKVELFYKKRVGRTEAAKTPGSLLILSALCPQTIIDHMAYSRRRGEASRTIYRDGRVDFRQTILEATAAEAQMLLSGVRAEEVTGGELLRKSEPAPNPRWEGGQFASSDRGRGDGGVKARIVLRLRNTSELNKMVRDRFIEIAKTANLPLMSWADAGFLTGECWAQTKMVEPHIDKAKIEISATALEGAVSFAKRDKSGKKMTEAGEIIGVPNGVYFRARDWGVMAGFQKEDANGEFVTGWVSAMHRGLAQDPAPGQPARMAWTIETATGKIVRRTRSFCSRGRLWNPTRETAAFEVSDQDGKHIFGAGFRDGRPIGEVTLSKAAARVASGKDGVLALGK